MDAHSRAVRNHWLIVYEQLICNYARQQEPEKIVVDPIARTAAVIYPEPVRNRLNKYAEVWNRQYRYLFEKEKKHLEDNWQSIYHAEDEPEHVDRFSSFGHLWECKDGYIPATVGGSKVPFFCGKAEVTDNEETLKPPRMLSGTWAYRKDSPLMLPPSTLEMERMEYERQHPLEVMARALEGLPPKYSPYDREGARLAMPEDTNL